MKTHSKFDTSVFTNPGTEIILRGCNLYFDGDFGGCTVIYYPFTVVYEDLDIESAIEAFIEELTDDGIEFLAETFKDTQTNEDWIDDRTRAQRSKCQLHEEWLMTILPSDDEGMPINYKLEKIRSQKGPFIDAAGGRNVSG